LPLIVAHELTKEYRTHKPHEEFRQIVQPSQSLEKQAAELGWGNFEAIEKPVGGIAEIHHLQAQLILMAQKVKAAQKNLRGYVNMITAGQEDERRRLARELHDDVVQSLIALDLS